MLKPDFYIHTEEPSQEGFEHCRLMLELNDRALHYVLLDTKRTRPVAIKCFSWDPAKAGPAEEVVADIVNEDEWIAYTRPAETVLVYNFEDSQLIPERLFRADLARPLSQLVSGDLYTETVLDEKIPWWELHNLYRVPPALHELAQAKFAGAKTWHAYSLQLKCYKMFTAREEREYLKVLFYPSKMIVLACRNGQLQLIRSFAYADSKDVVYHLLNCCHQLYLDPEQVSMVLSGMIEKRSKLFEDLYQYFRNIDFDSPGDAVKSNDLLDYPPHFFASLLKMAVCV